MAFEANFARYVDNQDARGLYSLLQSTGASQSAKVASLDALSRNSKGAASAAVEFMRGAKEGVSSEGLDAYCSALQHWCTFYASQEKTANVRWMVPPLLQFALAPRETAIALDLRNGSQDGPPCQDAQKRLVERLRDHFQKLHRDRHRREGALVICCELLRLYFRLDQAAQCTFLLNAVCKEGLDMPALPKALSLPLCFLWGKYCVMNGNVAEGVARLHWALENCPPKCFVNRRRIMAYLVPCRLACGLYPTRRTLQKYSLDFYEVITKAISDGDVRGFNAAFEKHTWDLVDLGTFLLVEKLKVVCYRNLVRRVHDSICEGILNDGQSEQKHKHDLAPYEHAMMWQDDCDADETICVLANLIYLGAVRGYLSDDHHKIVFSKAEPFPRVSAWGPRA